MSTIICKNCKFPMTWDHARYGCDAPFSVRPLNFANACALLRKAETRVAELEHRLAALNLQLIETNSALIVALADKKLPQEVSDG